MIDFKTAKEIVLALKKIAANISGDKSNSNSNTNTDDNTNTNDDNLNYVIFNQNDLGHGMFISSMFFTLENNDLDNIRGTVSAGTESTLGELFASNILIKLFNKAIEHINYMINEKGYTTGNVYMVYNIDNFNQNDLGGTYGNLYARQGGNGNEATGTIVISDLLLLYDNNDGYRIEFKNPRTNEIFGYATTETVFDENTPIIWNGGSYS